MLATYLRQVVLGSTPLDFFIVEYRKADPEGDLIGRRPFNRCEFELRALTFNL
jgi:hypothetical protein